MQVAPDYMFAKIGRQAAEIDHLRAQVAFLEAQLAEKSQGETSDESHEPAVDEEETSN